MWKNIEKYLIINKLRYDFFSFPLLILLLSFHIARHSFASVIALANNVSLPNVSKMLGHSNTRMTEHYAKLVDKCIGEEKDKLMGTFCTKE